MKCIYCGSMDSKVVDSRQNEDGTSIRRRRECIVCGKRFTTYETVESTPIMVIKKEIQLQLQQQEQQVLLLGKGKQKLE